MGPITDSLRAEIGALRKESADQRYFISQKDLSALLTKETITAAILECGIADYSHPAAVNYVLKEGKIVFGILVWRKWEHTLNSFIEHRILDSQLPLAVEQAEKVTQMLGLEFATKAQWDFLPRQLTKEMGGYHCHFRKEEILPFTQKSELGRGSAGDVFKVTVWPSCQTIYPQVCVILAVPCSTADIMGFFVADFQRRAGCEGIPVERWEEKIPGMGNGGPRDPAPPAAPKYCSSVSVLYP